MRRCHCSPDSRVDYLIQALALRVVLEHDLAETRAVDGFVRIDNAAAEMGDDFLIRRLAGSDGVMRQLIGVDHLSAPRGQRSAVLDIAGSKLWV